MTSITRWKRTKEENYLSFRLALLVGGVGEGRTLCQSVVDGLVRPVMVSHEAEGVGVVELVDLVQVNAGRVPSRLPGLSLRAIHLFRRDCRRDMSRVVRRHLVGGSRATGEGGVVVAAAMTV